MSRPSIVSSTTVVPFCGAEGGSAYVATLTEVAVPAMLAVPSGFVLTEKSDKVRRVLPVRSFAAMTQPLELVSVWLTGTGVKAFVPSAFLRVCFCPVRNESSDGHVGPGAGLVTQSTSERR